jgi:hypothetical protein
MLTFPGRTSAKNITKRVLTSQAPCGTRSTCLAQIALHILWNVELTEIEELHPLGSLPLRLRAIGSDPGRTPRELSKNFALTG